MVSASFNDAVSC